MPAAGPRTPVAVLICADGPAHRVCIATDSAHATPTAAVSGANSNQTKGLARGSPEKARNQAPRRRLTRDALQIERPAAHLAAVQRADHLVGLVRGD